MGVKIGGCITQTDVSGKLLRAELLPASGPDRVSLLGDAPHSLVQGN